MFNVSRSLSTLTAGLVLASAPLMAQSGPSATVYAMTNATQNQLVVYDRSESGVLTESKRVSTGGSGTGAGLGSNNGIQISANKRWLFTVNAGSNTIAVFDLRAGGPFLVDVANSGGSTPISVALAGANVYVLNGGSPANVAGLRFGLDGRLHPIPNSIQLLSEPAPVAPQIGYSRDGFVVVTEKATNNIDVFTANFDGSLSPASIQASSGPVPFGFLFDHFGHMIVVEAGASVSGGDTVSSYHFSNTGTLETISASVPNFQLSTCWIALAASGQFIYTANTMSDNISAYSVSRYGQLQLVGNGIAATVAKGSKPADLAFSGSGRFLYVLNGGLGNVSGWIVNPDGSLVSAGTFGTLPASATGLAGL